VRIANTVTAVQGKNRCSVADYFFCSYSKSAILWHKRA
jgi:hypothetical protein